MKWSELVEVLLCWNCGAQWQGVEGVQCPECEPGVGVGCGPVRWSDLDLING